MGATPQQCPFLNGLVVAFEISSHNRTQLALNVFVADCYAGVAALLLSKSLISLACCVVAPYAS
jgi:hypothetical protein